MIRPSLSIVLALHESPLLPKEERQEILTHFLSSVRDLLNENEQLVLSLYLSGPFLKLASQRKGALLSQLRALTQEGRLEWLGGGMFDPLFPLLPRKMQQLQIRSHLQALEQLVGVRPRGFWLPSFVWEQSLISLLVDEGFEYTLLKEYQIEKATWRNPTGYGYWTVEDRGRVLRILSATTLLSEELISGETKQLAERLEPSETPRSGEVIALSMLRNRRGRYEAEWFDRLRELSNRFGELGVRSPFLKRLCEQIDDRLPLAGISLQSSVGRSLGLDERLQSCRDLLLLQSESNYLHKRMIWLWRNIERLPEGRHRHSLEEALLPVANVYWYRHRPESGGVSNLEDRAACHQMMGDLERRLRRASKMEGARFDWIDFLGNGERQLLYRSSGFSFLVEPRFGGRLRALEYSPLDLSLINGFHPAQLDPQGGNHYSVDPITALRDWFAPKEPQQLEEWLHYLKDDSGLLQAPHDCSFRLRKEGAQVQLAGEQQCRTEGRNHPIRIEKALTLKEESHELLIHLQLTNLAFHALQGRYAVEFNLSFSNWDTGQQKLRIDPQGEVSLEGASLLEKVGQLEYRDQKLEATVVLKFMKPCSLLLIPISTPGEGEEHEPQCLKVIAFWDLHLMGQEKFNSALSLRIRRKGLLSK